ncbi:hypothetical protein HMPREF1051_2319 [Neisseria sicca VK64]|uniref:Uncharacterized protein n=1 Tax=Neisseria sicca VK64 TaxID=1095748 RepID=I2NUE1_NEISI|nr:hypothetical protein HMPREF1051_2319 [Neisseria sicca VK64]
MMKRVTEGKRSSEKQKSVFRRPFYRRDTCSFLRQTETRMAEE